MRARARRIRLLPVPRHPAYDGGMAQIDSLGAAVASVRVGRAEACRVTAAGDWGMRFTGSDVTGFHVLLAGDAWLITSGAPPRALAPGDVVLASHGTEHGLSPAPAALETLPEAVLGGDDAGSPDVEFACGAYWLAGDRVPRHLRLPGVIVVSPDDARRPQLRALLDLLRLEVSATSPGAGIAKPALLDLLLTHVLRQWLDEQDDALLPEHVDPAVGLALDRLHAAPERPWTVQELSDVAGLPRRQFSRRFAEVVGRPPMRYLTTWRLTRGAQLLRESTYPLSGVARRVGYGSEFAFSAAFRREFGIAPGRYRDRPAVEPER